jgi:hypothetical protein
MESPNEHELKLREARVQGAEHGIQALKDATLELERRATQFDADIRRLEDGQASTIRWTVGSILGLGVILGTFGIVLLLNQAGERRELDARLASQIESIRAQTDIMAESVAALTGRSESTDQAAGRALEASEVLLGMIAELRDGLDESDRRTDLMLGRLNANIDNIRADFAYLVEGGGFRSSFDGQIYIDVPYESADVDRAGIFLSDIDISLLSSGGQLRAGTLRLVVPRHGRIPQQRVTYSLSPQFLTALADLLQRDDTDPLRRVANVDALVNSFYEYAVWPALIQATVDGKLTEFLIDAQPIGEEEQEEP